MASVTKYFLLGGLGFVLGGPIGAALAVVITSMVESSKALPGAKEGDGNTTRGRAQTYASDIKVSLLVLIACVMKVDGHVRKSELDLVKRFLVRNYGEQGALEALQILKSLLEQDMDPMAVAKQIADNVNYSTRLELLHFLFDLANTDGEFADSELQMIANTVDSMTLIGFGLKDWKVKNFLHYRDAGKVFRSAEEMGKTYGWTEEDVPSGVRASQKEPSP